MGTERTYLCSNKKFIDKKICDNCNQKNICDYVSSVELKKHEILKDLEKAVSHFEAYCNYGHSEEFRYGILILGDVLNKHLLNTSDNSDYAVKPTASPKLPSLEDISKSLALHEPINEFYRDGVHDCYNIVKKLGNFA